ncbi:MAG: thioredoxin domain-containing protein, partial [Pseudomonadota bacterium]
MKTNRLAQETSPYLQQHAENPVDWYPWCEEALERARREDKPILLSIGYSACHWCHVMAHESFEDPDTAKVMNDLFVNIKVDREERPDIDKIYQLSHQLMTRRPGGWPLNMFLTPAEHIPFFGGTYFPKQASYNMPAFVDVLRNAADYYAHRKSDLAQHSAGFSDTLKTISAPPMPQPADAVPLSEARREIESVFDPEHGGFGPAPKFPHTTTIEFLLRRWAASEAKDEKALHMASKSLEMMARGGIYDQLGGGFCRYSVDDRWLIPHFEKMLYDNGLLLSLYANAWLATANPLFEKTALETAGWVMREMQSREGGYYSSLDADSEGEEGKFYVWSAEKVKSLLNRDEYAVVSTCHGLDKSPNFEGRWHLYATKTPEEAAVALGTGIEAAKQHLAGGLKKLFLAREQRVHPGRDEKILTSWNALMIKGMAVAGRVFGREEL